MAKVKIRITNRGAIGGFIAEIKKGEVWVRLNKWVGGALVSFDSREQALKACQRAARDHVRESRA